jgi:putative ABC transport system permease protein
VLTAQVALPGLYYQSPEQRTGFIDAMIARLAGTPGVQSAGIAAFLPFGGNPDSSPFEIVGRQPAADSTRPHAEYNLVSEGYFAAMGMRLLRGRLFERTDVRGGPGVVVIDEQLAKQYFPGEDPIGRRIKHLWVGDEDPVIIGIVGTVKTAGLARADKATVYYSFRQNGPSAFAVAIRGTLPPASFTSAVRAAVAAQDPRIPVYDVRLMTDRVEESLGARRLAVWVLAAFATLALALAVLGISGVLSYAVSQRTRELGIRVALGARPDAIVGMVVRRGATLAGIGLVAGTALFLATGRLVGSALYGVGPRDPLTIAAAASLLAGVALLASGVPARRAARTDALTALRQE